MCTLISRIIAIFLLTLVISLSAQAQTTESEPSTATVSSLLAQLPDASLRETRNIVQQLAEVGDASLLPLYRAMREGELHVELSSRKLIAVRAVSGVDTAFDIYSGDNLGPRSSDDIDKIRVNILLRKQLSSIIAQVSFISGELKDRRAAALSLLDDIDEETIALVEKAQQQESDGTVLETIALVKALYLLQNAAEEDDQLAALDALDGRLETSVKIRLSQMLEQDDLSPAVKKKVVGILDGINSKISFYEFLEQVFFGLSLGSVLLLAAIGLAITFGVMGVINMAHGEMIMLGAYTTYAIQLFVPVEWSILIAIPAAFCVSGVVGIAIERGVIQFLHGRPLETLLATFGISLILQQAVRTFVSSQNRPVSTPEWMSGSLQLNPVLDFTYNRLYILVFALLVFFALQLVLKKTSLGLNVRAVSQNRQMARAMGIRTQWVDSLTFGLGSGIAGVAGVALSQLTNVGPNLGQAYIIDSFMVVVFGGVGNLLGTLAGAFSLGIFNKFLEPIFGPVGAKILVLIFIILFIQWRPKGLFPQKGRAAE